MMNKETYLHLSRTKQGRGERKKKYLENYIEELFGKFRPEKQKSIKTTNRNWYLMAGFARY